MSRLRSLGLVAALSLFTMSAFTLSAPATALGNDLPSDPIVTCGAVSFENIPTGWVVMLSPGTGTYGATDMPVYLSHGPYTYNWFSDVGTNTGITGHFGITGCTPPAGPALTCGGTVSFSGIPANWTAHLGPDPVGSSEVVHSAADFPLHLVAGGYWYQWYDSYGLGQDATGFSGEFTISPCPTPTPTPVPTPASTPTPISTPLPSPTPSASPSPTLTASTPSPSDPLAGALGNTASPCLSACGSSATSVLPGSGSNGGDGFPWPLLLLGALGLGALAFGAGLLVAKRRSDKDGEGSRSANGRLPDGATAGDPGPPALDGGEPAAE